MDSVQQNGSVNTARPQRKRSRLAAALGVDRRTLEVVLSRAQYNLHTLRTLTLADLRVFVSAADAERVFYLVQWERLQSHFELYGTLPERAELEPLLKTLTPIFERHFSGRSHPSSRLNEMLISLYRSELSGTGESGTGENTWLNPNSPSMVQRFLARVLR